MEQHRGRRGVAAGDSAMSVNTVLLALVLTLPGSICALGAVYLAAHGVTGWGWFLVIAGISATVSYKSEPKK
jgi:hypothetical protein